MRPGDQRSRVVLTAILVGGVASTLLHYTHNFVAVGDYPGSTETLDLITRVLIVGSWPILTAIGLLGLRRYGQGRFREARTCLALYSLLGITTLGHFAQGAVEIPTVFYVSIFTDAITGFAALTFAVWLHLADDSTSAEGAEA
jgi:hypothetical protein